MASAMAVEGVVLAASALAVSIRSWRRSHAVGWLVTGFLQSESRVGWWKKRAISVWPGRASGRVVRVRA
ncbi:hypothetical protein D3C59_35055 [Streptomyces sp. SHP22-7]|nr:hypothetical protein D3C59_35055 [Streptomyces sp. SHP22-7]